MSVVNKRPAPKSEFDLFGKIIEELECGMDLASQSLTPPRTAYQEVCGEYRAIRFSIQAATTRFCHELKVYLLINLIKTIPQNEVLPLGDSF